MGTVRTSLTGSTAVDAEYFERPATISRSRVCCSYEQRSRHRLCAQRPAWGAAVQAFGKYIGHPVA